MKNNVVIPYPSSLIDPEANEAQKCSDNNEQETLISSINQTNQTNEATIYTKFNQQINVLLQIFPQCLYRLILKIAAIIFSFSLITTILLHKECDYNCYQKICYPKITDKLTKKHYPCVCHVEVESIQTKDSINTIYKAACGESHYTQLQWIIIYSLLASFVIMYCVCNYLNAKKKANEKSDKK